MTGVTPNPPKLAGGPDGPDGPGGPRGHERTGADGVHDATAAFLTRHRTERTELLAERLVDIIEAENPGYGQVGVVSRVDLWLSCLDNIRRVLELLAGTLDPAARPRVPGPVEHDPAYDAARATGRRRAEQGQPLDDVLRSFRMGGRMIWEDLLDEAHDLAAGDVRAIGSALWEVVDQTSAQVAVSYHQHVRSTLRADEQLRAELWEGVLGGRARDVAFAHQAERVLDVPHDADLLVVATSPDLDLVEAERHLAPHASAWVQRSRECIGLVALRSPDPTGTHEALATLADDLGLALGVSGTVHGLADVPAGLREADLARTAVAPGATGLVTYEQYLPEVLLLSAPEISARLVGAWVLPLVRLPRGEGAVLLDTLQAWVDSGGSPTRTAERVPCHRNTVLNRLRRVGDVTGHRLDESTPPLDLVLALRAHGLGLVPPDAPPVDPSG